LIEGPPSYSNSNHFSPLADKISTSLYSHRFPALFFRRDLISSRLIIPAIQSALMSTQTVLFYMPSRGEWNAPSYNRSKPRELVRFFKELERLFVRASVTNEEEKKEQVLRYVDFEVEEFWQTLPEFKNPLATYAEFKAAILSIYPDASGDYLYSLSDLDLLISERQQLGINNATDLADFHLRFHMITSWLVDRNHLCEVTQKRAYSHAFPPRLMSLIEDRLQIKFPDLHPNLPYPISDVYDAAQYFLHKPTSRPQSYFERAPAPPATAPYVPATPDPPINPENLQTIFAELSKTLADVLGRNSQRMERTSSNRNIHGLDWLSATDPTENSSFYAQKLTLDDRISQIEAELYALRASEFSSVPAVFNEAEKAKSAHVDDSDDEDHVPIKVPKKEIAPKVKAQPQENKRCFSFDPVVPTSISAPQLTIPNRVDPEPKDPVREAKHMAYTSSSARIIGVSVPPVAKKLETAYKSRPFIYKAPITASAYVRIQPSESAITLQPALFLSPEVCAPSQDVTVTCKELSRKAHTTRNPLQVDYSEASGLSPCPFIEAPLFPSSTPASNLSETLPTAVNITEDQPRLNDLSPFPFPFPTHFEFSDDVSLRNTLEPSSADPHVTSHSTCDPSNSIPDPAIATFPATLNIPPNSSDFCASSKEYNTHSGHCDLSILRPNSATLIAPPTISNHCDFCVSDLKFAVKLPISERLIFNDQAETLPIFLDVSDPFRNIPTLDPQLAPYVPNSRYRQDRKVLFKVALIPSLHFLHIQRILFIFLFVHCIFRQERTLSASVSVHAYCCSHIGRFKSNLGSPGRIFVQQSDICAILRFSTCLRISEDFIKENHHKPHIRTLLARFARINLYLDAIWILGFSVAYSIGLKLFLIILGFTIVLLPIFTIVAQKSQGLVGLVGLVIRQLQKSLHLTQRSRNSQQTPAGASYTEESKTENATQEEQSIANGCGFKQRRSAIAVQMPTGPTRFTFLKHSPAFRPISDFFPFSLPLSIDFSTLRFILRCDLLVVPFILIPQTLNSSGWLRRY
jgi:hypothetical protein